MASAGPADSGGAEAGLVGAAAPEVELGRECRPAEAGGDAAGAMLGKDYMLAIILVNCDGVHGGSAGREDPGLRGEAGRWRRATPRLKLREEEGRVRPGVRTRVQMNPALCTVIISKTGGLNRPAWTSSLRVDKVLF